MPQAPELLLPKPYLEKHSSFKLKGAEVQQWLDALPKANLGESSRLLLHALIELNKLKCAPKERFSVLEAVRPTVHMVLKGLSQHYLNKATVLPAKNQRVAELCKSLNSLLSDGYALVVQDLDQKRILLPGQGKMFCVSLHRAMAEQSHILLRWLQLHAQEERDFWLHLHRLYYFAVRRGVEDRLVKDPLLGDCSLQSCYLRPLMLAAANPYQLSQAQLQALFTLLPGWAARLRLRGVTLSKWQANSDGIVEDFSDCLLTFNPADDVPPSYQVISEGKAGRIAIQTDDLMLDLERQQRNQVASLSGSFEQPDKALLTHLSAVWSNMAKRRFERVESAGNIDVAFGFASAHYYVAGEVFFEEFVQLTTMAPVAGDASVIPLRAEHVEYIDYGAEDKSAEAFGISKRYRLHRIALKDASSRGYCICLPEEEALNVHKDDLLSLREEGQEHWSVGVIRWVRQQQGDRYEAGIDLLGVAVEPCHAKLVRLDVAVSNVKMAFVFPRDVMTGSPPRILVQRKVYHPNESLLIESPGQTLCVRLQKRLEAIGNYDLFEYEREAMPQSEGIDETGRALKEGENAPPDFWESL